MVVDKLVALLGFDFDDSELKTFKSSIDGAEKLVIGFAASIAAAAVSTFAFVNASAAATDEQGKMADQLGISVEELDAWQHAATLSGESASSAVASISSFSQRISESARGMGSGIEAFGLLGISVTDSNGRLKETPDLLLEVSEAMQTLSKAKQIELAEKLGLSGSLRLLQQGPAAIRGLTSEAMDLGVATAEDAQIAADFQDSIARVWRVVKDLSRSLTRELAPVMTSIAEAMTDWWINNRELIQQDLPRWIDRAVVALKLLALAASAFIGVRLVAYMWQAVTATGSLTKALASLITTAVSLPAVIIAAIAVIALLADDAKTFFEGGDSLIGGLIARFPEWANAISMVAAVLATVYDLGKMVFDGWVALFDLVSNNSFSGLIDDITLIAKELFPEWLWVLNAVKDAFSFLNIAGKVAFDGILAAGDLVLTMVNTIVDGWVLLFDLIKNTSIADLIDDVPDFVVSGVKSLFGGDPIANASSQLRSTDEMIGTLINPQVFAGAMESPTAPTPVNRSQEFNITTGPMTVSISEATDTATIINEIETRQADVIKQAALDVTSRVDH